jgi:hypothetical protein
MTDLEKKIEDHKYKLADTLAPLISKEGLTDVTDWIERHGGSVDGVGCAHNGVARSVAFILEATGDYQREQLEDKSRFYVKKLPTRSLEQKYPTLFKFSFFLLGVIASLGGVLLQSQLKKQDRPAVIQVHDSRIDSLGKVVVKLQTDFHVVQDTLTKYKERLQQLKSKPK